MCRSMKKLVFFLILISCIASAQKEHAWIYFKDKPDVAASLANPYSILSQEAIERKALRNTPIDERDVPVHESYITSLKQQPGITIKAKSKWFNCVHVIGNLQEIQHLATLEFVDKIEFANRSIENRVLKNLKKADLKLETEADFHYGFAQNQTEMLNTHYLHEKEYTGEGLTIAVLDAGFPDISNLNVFGRSLAEGKILGGYDFPGRSENHENQDLSNHGTLVLSTMAGFIEDQFVGTAPDASYYLFRTEVAASETPVEESYWVEAAERADSLGVDIINSSLSYALFDNPAYSYSMEDMDGETTFVSRGANIATEKGMLVVVSAGNSGNSDNFPKIGAPADARVLTVGAVDENGNYVDFSSVGPTADGRIKPDVMAQGLDIVAINEENNLVQASGTSFSAPIIAGSVASFWQINSSWTNLQVMQLVREASSRYNNPDPRFGYGIPDFELALKTLEIKSNSAEIAISPNPVKNILSIRKNNPGTYNLKVFDSLGQKLLEKENVEDQIDLSGFSRGIYIAMFEKNNFRKSFIIIKK